MRDGHMHVRAMPCTSDEAERQDCDVRDALDRIGDRWSVFIIVQLVRKPMRFLELQRAVYGISQRMLTLTLRTLERDGLVHRQVLDTRPPSVEYSLTAIGHQLTAAVRTLADWSNDHRAAIAASRKAWDMKQQSGVRPINKRR